MSYLRSKDAPQRAFTVDIKLPSCTCDTWKQTGKYCAHLLATRLEISNGPAIRWKGMYTLPQLGYHLQNIFGRIGSNNNAHKPVRAEPKEKGVKMKSDMHWQKQMANVLEKWLDRPPTPTWPPGEGITFDVGCAQEEDMGSKQNMSPQACK